jgi:hypothetical protein
VDSQRQLTGMDSGMASDDCGPEMASADQVRTLNQKFGRKNRVQT